MVGDILRAEREKQGLTIKDVEHETSIRSLYIEAIEQGNKKALPSEVYVKGFIRNYAEFLNLDVEQIAKQYREELSSGIEDGCEAAENLAEETGHGPFSSGSDFHERVQKSHRMQNILAVFAVIAAVFIGGIYYFFGDEGALKEKPGDHTPAVRKESGATTGGGADGNASGASFNREAAPPSALDATGNTAAASSMQPGKIEVMARFTGRCWVEAISDGAVVYEGMAEKNQTFSWQGKERLYLVLGDAGAVDLTYNGRSLGPLGKKGDVVEKYFTPNRMEDVK